ncbi:MAG: TolC family protein [Muribaculaceae bacterium]|nr:TolC family protein [Muribaculaceae bacterium]
MKKTILSTFILILASPFAAFSQVSLDSCRNMALRNNKLIRIAQANLEGASHLKSAAKAAYLPGIDFTGTYFYNQHIINLLEEDAKLPTMSFDPATGSYKYNLVTGADGKPVVNPSTGSYIPSEIAVIPKDALSYDVHNVFAGAFTLTQPIYMGGQIRALNKIAGFGEKIAAAMTNNATQEIVYTVDEAYWTVVSLKEKKRLAESFVALTDSLCHNVRLMLDQGVATRSDLLSVEVRVNEANIALTKVSNGLVLSRMALAQVCGLPPETTMDLADENLNSEDLKPAPPVDINEVYSRRADLEAVRQTVNLLKSREKLSLSEMLPKIALVGAYTFSNPNLIDGFQKRFGGGFSVGAMLQVPIWHWGGDYNKYRAAKSTTKAQQLLLEDLEEKVDLQVKQARFSLDEADKTFRMASLNMKKAEENLRQAQIGFREGVLTTSDVLAAQTAWLGANSEKIDAEIGLRLARTYLEKVAGRLGW